jgi:hypothetical protein
MSTITTRSGKGSPLTHDEVDSNFTDLNTDKYQSGDSPSFVNVTVSGTVDGRNVSADGTKLDGIETGATADQTGAQIKTAYQAELNAFTDAQFTKLSGIETAADVTDATNVAAAGALMDSEVTNLAQVKAFSSADYATAAEGTLATNALPSSALGVTVQAYDADLTALGGLAKTDSNFIVGNGTTWVAETGATARTSLGLVIGTDVQAYDADLTTIGGLAKTDNNFIVSNGTAWVAESGATLRTSAGLGTTNDVQFDSFGVGTAASGTTGEIRATNNVTAYYSSDARLKENVTNIGNAVDIVKQLNGVRYDWTASYIESKGGEDGMFVRKQDIGVIAQEVEKVFPEIVAENSEGYKAVRYERLVPVLIEAVKELSREIERLKGDK